MDDFERERETVRHRIHIIEGVLAMLERDDLHARLRSCDTLEEARELLMSREFGLSKIQAVHVLDQPNRRYVGASRTELAEELGELLRLAERLGVGEDGDG